MVWRDVRSRTVTSLSRLLLLTLVISGSAIAQTFPAPPPPPGVCVYFSDATFTTVVGRRVTGCCGAVLSSTGTTSPHALCRPDLSVNCTMVLCPQ